MAGDVRFKIDGKTYDTASVDQISLRDVVLFNSQAADMGLPATWADIERAAGEMADMPEGSAPHPDSLLMFAVTVWAARRIAGDDVTLEQALDVPMSSIEIVEARKVPKDRQQSKKKNSRPAGVQAIAAVSEPSPTETTPPTSSEQSASA
jgi:hypothetical protein